MSDETIEELLTDNNEWYKQRRANHLQDIEQDKTTLGKMMRDLAEPFPAEMERTLNKKGVSLTYIPVSEVITRLNRVLGVSNWSFDIVKCERDSHDPDFIVAHVRLTANFPSLSSNTRVVKDGIGGQKIKRTRQDNEIIDLGDEMKGAVSDALKKAAQQLGVGLYLARDIDAIEMDEAMYASEDTKPQQTHSVAASNEIVEAYERFKGIRDVLSDEARLKLREFWAEYSGGRAIPKPTEFTKAELEALIIEALRIQLNGTVSIDPNAASPA